MFGIVGVMRLIVTFAKEIVPLHVLSAQEKSNFGLLLIVLAFDLSIPTEAGFISR